MPFKSHSYVTNGLARDNVLRSEIGTEAIDAEIRKTKGVIMYVQNNLHHGSKCLKTNRMAISLPLVPALGLVLSLNAVSASQMLSDSTLAHGSGDLVSETQ